MTHIPNASEIRQQTPNEGFEQAVQAVVRDIERASKQGRRSTCFNPPAYWFDTEFGRSFIRYDEEVKEEFRKKGYTFRPTGYVGGVWQTTEHICW